MDVMVTAKDFEGLTSNQMEWASVEWEDQLERFELTSKPEFKFIFWVEDASSLVLARHFLIENKFTFVQCYDEAVQEYVLITDYAGSWDRVSA